MRFRLGVTFVTLLAAMTALFVWAGMASGATKTQSIQYADPTDPQNTNIPYLAWAGETVKVTKCLNFESWDGVLPSTFSNLTGTLNISGWSGADMAGPNTPFFLQSNSQGLTVTGSYVRHRGLCWSGLITSEKPGLATLKLAVNDPNLERWFTDSKSNGGQGVLFEHDFLVIWMQSQAPTITEVPTPGDPAGDGTFKPVLQSDGSYAFEPGLIQAEVKGTFPLLQNWSGLAPNNTVTLPDDWKWLQDHFAMDASPLGSQSPGAAGSLYGFNRWDIHDDNLTTEGHTTSSFCTDKTDPSLTIDAVDNCLGSRWSGWGAGLGPFSNIFGGTDSWAVGPFDPIRADNTLLSDGKVDASDAPMPALRVDVALGAASTVGTLSAVDKTDIYIRDASKYASDPHNLYAPFYKAYIPAAWGNLNNPTSGVYGASFANNYASFLTQGFDLQAPVTAPATVDSSLFGHAPLYDYWEAFPLVTQDGYNGCYDVNNDPFPLPTGNLSQAVYTDEHGEAYVQFNPDMGNVLTPDSNGRCDIYTGSLVGNATITATSVYPDQVPTWDGSPKVSNTLAKTVDFDPSKVLACVPKGTNEAYCVETIKGLEGNPAAGAPVEFSAQAGQGASPTLGADSTAGVPPYDTTGQGGPDVNSGPVYAGGFVDLTTGANGEAGIYVHSSTNQCIDISVENVGTRNGGAGIFRDVDFNPTSGKACSNGGSDNSGGGGTTTSGTTTSGTTTSGSVSGGGGGQVVLASPVSISAPAPTVAPASAAKTGKVVKAMSLVSASVIKTRTGRYLSVRVNGSAKTAQLRITLIGKNGKSHIVLRSVATNHLVRVPNLKLAPSIKSVRVGLA
jgi:hypothetical protein